MIGRFGLNEQSFVVEVASNDGYLLQYFVQQSDAGFGNRTRGERGKSRGRKGRPHAGAVLRRRTRGRVGGGRPRHDLIHRQQRTRAGSRSERLRGRAQDYAEAPRCLDARISTFAPASSSTMNSIRSITSTSPTFHCSLRKASCRLMASGYSTWKNWRRTANRSASMPAAPKIKRISCQPTVGKVIADEKSRRTRLAGRLCKLRAGR